MRNDWFQKKNILVQDVASGTSVASANIKLLSHLKKVIPDPKARSPKWLSTSVPCSEWSTRSGRLSSAEYFVNNLTKPVLFERISILIPKNAIVIEIAPEGLLQTLITKSVHENVVSVALGQRNHENNVQIVLQALGRLYNEGLHPQLARLYPDVEFPVSRGTPMIAPLIKWDHSEDWFVASYKTLEKITIGERIADITVLDEDFQYMQGHVIDGRNLLPATGYLTMVWETLGMMRGQWYTEFAVVFENVKFLRATTFPKVGKVQLTFMIEKGASDIVMSQETISHAGYLWLL